MLGWPAAIAWPTLLPVRLHGNLLRGSDKMELMIGTGDLMGLSKAASSHAGLGPVRWAEPVGRPFRWRGAYFVNLRCPVNERVFAPGYRNRADLAVTLIELACPHCGDAHARPAAG